MDKTELDLIFQRWRAGEPEAWELLKPELMKRMRKSRPALNFPEGHMAALRGLLCMRLDMATPQELRRLPGSTFWEFYASLARTFLIELLKEGAYAHGQNEAPAKAVVSG